MPVSESLDLIYDIVDDLYWAGNFAALETIIKNPHITNYHTSVLLAFATA
jgi:hypothetical protein